MLQNNFIYVYINPTVINRNSCISIPYNGQAMLIKYPKKKTLHIDNSINNVFVTLNNEVLIFTYSINIPEDADTLVYKIKLGPKTVFKIIKKLLFNELDVYFRRIERKLNKLSRVKLI